MTSSQNAPSLFLDRLAQNASSHPSKIAITFLSSGPDGGKVEQKLTYSELAQETSALASRCWKVGFLLEIGEWESSRALVK